LFAHPPPIVLPPNVSFPYWMISILYPSFWLAVTVTQNFNPLFFT
jgi:hypothetical protein